MNVLILVMSARREPWGALMSASIKTWNSEHHPQTRTVFYCGKSEGLTWTVSPSYEVFYSSSFGEDLWDVSSRTIEAFEKSLELEWDYLARPNSSCYVHKENLVKFCRTLHPTNAICGIMSDGDKPFLWGGCQYIFSRDVVEQMVAHKEKWNHVVMDDNSITLLLQELNFPLRSNGWCASINLQSDGSYLCLLYGKGLNFTFTDFQDINKAYGHFFFRVKQDGRRHEDIRIMHELKKYLL